MKYTELLRVMESAEKANAARIKEWKDKQIRGVLVDVKTGFIRDAAIEKSLESYYDALDCSTIDMPMRMIGGVPYTLICDDEGLFLEHPIASSVSPEGEMMTVGNIFVVKFDGVDDVCSLSDEDVENIMRHVCYIVDLNSAKKWQIRQVLEVEYPR